MNVDPSTLRARSNELRLWLGRRTATRTVRFGTFDEGLCSASFHRVAADACASDLEALVCLWRVDVEQGEERVLGPDDAVAFLDSLGAELAPISDAEWIEETTLITRSIREAIAEVRSGRRLINGKALAIPEGPLVLSDVRTYWGVFEDDRRLPDDTAFDFLSPGNVVDGVAVRRKWNDIALFARTRSEYVLFTWSTGA